MTLAKTVASMKRAGLMRKAFRLNLKTSLTMM
jgi:hypothetical protein